MYQSKRDYCPLIYNASETKIQGISMKFKTVGIILFFTGLNLIKTHFSAMYAINFAAWLLQQESVVEGPCFSPIHFEKNSYDGWM